MPEVRLRDAPRELWSVDVRREFTPEAGPAVVLQARSVNLDVAAALKGFVSEDPPDWDVDVSLEEGTDGGLDDRVDVRVHRSARSGFNAFVDAVVRGESVLRPGPTRPGMRGISGKQLGADILAMPIATFASPPQDWSKLYDLLQHNGPQTIGATLVSAGDPVGFVFAFAGITVVVRVLDPVLEETGDLLRALLRRWREDRNL